MAWHGIPVRQAAVPHRIGTCSQTKFLIRYISIYSSLPKMPCHRRRRRRRSWNVGMKSFVSATGRGHQAHIARYSTFASHCCVCCTQTKDTLTNGCVYESVCMRLFHSMPHYHRIQHVVSIILCGKASSTVILRVASSSSSLSLVRKIEYVSPNNQVILFNSFVASFVRLLLLFPFFVG